MKVLRSLCLMLLAALLLLGSMPAAALADGPEAERLSDYAVSGETFEALLSTRTKAKEPLLQDLCLDGMPLFRDKAGRWFYSLPAESPGRTDPTPSFTVPGGDVRLAVQGGITGETLRSGEPLRLLAYDDESYSLYEIVSTTLPLLTVEPAWNGIYQGEVPMELVLYDNRAEAETRQVALAGKIRVRGQSTSRFLKKGFKLSLTETMSRGNADKADANLLGLRYDDDWILYAGYNDQEKIRNVFCCQLWKNSCARDNSFGVDNGMEYRFVELFIGGEYYGLYALGYPIDAKQMELGRTAFGQTEESLYKKINWYQEAKVFWYTQGAVSGYALKDYVGDRPGNAWEALREYYRVLFYESPSDPAALRAWLDIPNTIDVALFFFMIQGSDNTDGSMKNVYLTHKQSGERDVMLYTPWDMDFTWGNQYTSGIATKTRMYVLTPEDNFFWPNGPIQKLLDAGDEDILGEVKTKYRQLRQGAWSEESMMTILDRFEADIFASGAYVREQERWPEGNYLEDSSVGLALFRQFIRERLAYVDSCIENLEA